MNNPTFESSLNEPTVDKGLTECCNEVNECVRRNPGTAVLVAVGIGLLIGLSVRSMRPEPSVRNRLAELLEELEDRLRGAAEPALRKAGALASEGASALHGGFRNGEAGVERLFSRARKNLRKIFS